MEEEPSQGSNLFADNDNRDSKSGNNFKIVGYNMLALAVYTFVCKFSGDGGGFIFDALFLVMHVIVCIIGAIAAKGPKVWMWLLSAVLVLAIGISTCVVIPPFVN